MACDDRDTFRTVFRVRVQVAAAGAAQASTRTVRTRRSGAEVRGWPSEVAEVGDPPAPDVPAPSVARVRDVGNAGVQPGEFVSEGTRSGRS